MRCTVPSKTAGQGALWDHSEDHRVIILDTPTSTLPAGILWKGRKRKTQRLHVKCVSEPGEEEDNSHSYPAKRVNEKRKPLSWLFHNSQQNRKGRQNQQHHLEALENGSFQAVINKDGCICQVRSFAKFEIHSVLTSWNSERNTNL